MIIVGWAIWAVTCALALWGFFTFLAEMFNLDPFSEGPEVFLSPSLQKLISGLYALSMTAAAIATAFLDISKLHLLWFVPLCEFGIRAIVRVSPSYPLIRHWYSIRHRNRCPSRILIKLPRKTEKLDSNCSLKEFPLLCLYFDSFEEIKNAWQKAYFEAARHDSDTRSCQFSLDEIINDENTFLELYKNKLLRLILGDSTELRRDDEEYYWDNIVHPENYVLSFRPDSDPELVADAKEDEKKINDVVEAIKLRYGL